jgi:hypothetical protein
MRNLPSVSVENMKDKHLRSGHMVMLAGSSVQESPTSCVLCWSEGSFPPVQVRGASQVTLVTKLGLRPRPTGF